MPLPTNNFYTIFREWLSENYSNLNDDVWSRIISDDDVIEYETVGNGIQIMHQEIATTEEIYTENQETIVKIISRMIIFKYQFLITLLISHDHISIIIMSYHQENLCPMHEVVCWSEVACVYRYAEYDLH